jgi:hypothetical protein
VRSASFEARSRSSSSSRAVSWSRARATCPSADVAVARLEAADGGLEPAHVAAERRERHGHQRHREHARQRQDREHRAQLGAVEHHQAGQRDRRQPTDTERGEGDRQHLAPERPGAAEQPPQHGGGACAHGEHDRRREHGPTGVVEEGLGHGAGEDGHGSNR